MIRINNWQDLSLIEDDPELWREAYGFLSVCAYESWSTATRMITKPISMVEKVNDGSAQFTVN